MSFQIYLISKFISAENASVDSSDEMESPGLPALDCRILEFVWEASPQPSSSAQSIWECQEVSCHSQFRSLIMKYLSSLMETEVVMALWTLPLNI